MYAGLKNTHIALKNSVYLEIKLLDLKQIMLTQGRGSVHTRQQKVADRAKV